MSFRHGRLSTYSFSKSRFRAYLTERVEQDTLETISFELKGPSSIITPYTFLQDSGSPTSSKIVFDI